MIKKFLMLSIIHMLTISFVTLADAGLINYDRREKRGGPATPTRRTAAPAPAPSAAAPAWARQAPRVQTAEERRYDVNRDGLLQTAEVKIYLRDVIDVITQKGGFTVNSEILRPYDRNRDGVVSSTEVGAIKTDVSN